MKTRIALITLILAVLFSSHAFSDHHLKGESEFNKPTIDIGCVVSDIDASIKFYTEAIGFKVAGQFIAPPELATAAGLTNNKPLDVKVLTLGEGEGATSLKLMQVQGRKSKAKNDYIDTTLGFSYITVFVTSTGAAMARLKEAGVKPIAKGPVTLPADLDSSMALTIVRDPDGNFVELIGPKPQK